MSDWRTKPASTQLVAIAFGGAARIAVRYGLTADQAAELMRSAWSIVQDGEDKCEPSKIGDS